MHNNLDTYKYSKFNLINKVLEQIDLIKNNEKLEKIGEDLPQAIVRVLIDYFQQLECPSLGLILVQFNRKLFYVQKDVSFKQNLEEINDNTLSILNTVLLPTIEPGLRLEYIALNLLFTENFIQLLNLITQEVQDHINQIDPRISQAIRKRLANNCRL